MTTEPISNKNQNLGSLSDVAKPYLKRTVHVGWRHRESFTSDYRNMGTVIGQMIKIEINGNEDYTVNGLKDIMLASYVNDQNQFFFSNSLVWIGTYEGLSIQKFEDSDGKECNFWEYSKLMLRKKSHNLKIYLLTTLIKGKCIDDRVDHLQNKNELKNNKVTDEDQSAINKLPLHEQILNDIAKKEKTEHPSKATNPSDYHAFSREMSDTKKSRIYNVGTNLSDNLSSTPKKITSVDDHLTLTEYSNASKKSMYEDKLQSNARFTDDYSIPSPDFSKLTQKSMSGKKMQSDEVSKIKSKRSSSAENCSSVSNACFKKPSHIPKPYEMNLQKLIIPLIEESKITFSTEVIGKGGQGIVTKGKYLGSEVAIKTLQKGKYDKTILKEVKLLESLRHPNIIFMMAVCSTITQFHIVMEYFHSYSLHDVIFEPTVKDKLPINETKKNRIAHQLCCAIAYLHLQKLPIIHRDIKPANVLVNLQYVAKLCDLGLGKCNDLEASLQSTIKGRFCGTMMFMAPEIFLHCKEATVNSDIWSLACTLTELYSETEVWDIENSLFRLYNELQKLFVNGQKPNTDTMPKRLKNIIDQCFHYNPCKRPNISALLDFFESQCK